jgi:hypothetical protein
MVIDPKCDTCTKRTRGERISKKIQLWPIRWLLRALWRSYLNPAGADPMGRRFGGVLGQQFISVILRR